MKELAIGLGSNLGDRQANLIEAIRRLSVLFGPPARTSSFIETDPWGYQSVNRYLNGVAIFRVEEVEEVEKERSGGVEEWRGDVMNFMRFLKGIERDMGRVRVGDGYSDRPIDLDILFYGDRVIRTPELTIPHPHLHERAFVLLPLAEVCPDWVHPVYQKTIEQLVSDLQLR